MSHTVIIEDTNGGTVDVVWHCSDACAKTHTAYAGWHGCQEVHDGPQWCAACNDPLGYYTSGGEWISPERQQAEWHGWDLEDSETVTPYPLGERDPRLGKVERITRVKA
jgi:hypothetical protein